MDKPSRPPLMAPTSIAGLVAIHLTPNDLTPNELQLLNAFRSMTPARQHHCMDAALGLAQAFPRERREPALQIVRPHKKGGAN